VFGLGPATKIYLGIESVDMRKGFEGLFGLVRDHLDQDPLSGHLFLFTNRTRTRLKALVWDGSGLWVCAKRLERGRFRWPEARDARSVSMRPEELAMLINGMDLAQARQRPDLVSASACSIKHFHHSSLIRKMCTEYEKTLALVYVFAYDRTSS
jgi:transposase